eukprot:TRINITY_DN54962_c0_g1_i1.p1 TRINITY_DN54962_c0_g1~~TRINITY_DN54962_c0_g1_i1.p1  ORF type:complete len:777 (+),score=416.56 TRINITY_DN54962_c0_g1_i1:39-2333(+)
MATLTTVLIVVSVFLAVVALVLSLFYMHVKRLTKSRPPTKRQQIRALKESAQEWAIPFNELDFGKRVGKGSQGEVYRAMWQGTRVAVKKVDTRDVPDDVIEEFCQEAIIMRRLRHPNLTLFMGVSMAHPHLCIVTEYVDRGSLFDLLRDETSPLTWTRSLQIAMDIAQAMNYLHKYDPPILHRDLKSLNILIDGNWRAKVADFGMTRFQDEGTMTQCGSPLWMAPEMIRNDPYDEKADVYSFGIVLWELYTRRIPYRRRQLNPSILVVKVVREDLRPHIPSQCPASYKMLMQMCWDPKPTKRPSFRQVIRILQSFQEDLSITGHRPMADNKKQLTVPRPAPPMTDEQRERRMSEIHNEWDQKTWKVDWKKEIRIAKTLSRGRTSTVYKGTYRAKTVTIKRWELTRDLTPELKEKISAVFESVSSLRHPNVVLFMGAFMNNKAVGMVMEHMFRGTLEDIVSDEKVVLEWDTMLQLVIDAAQGMTYLHGCKPPVALGDMRANRLLVDKNWRVKVSGYGVESLELALDKQRLRAPSVWLAPEVLQSRDAFVPASDVYSFGMVLLSVLTRRRPFGEGRFTQELANDIIMEAKRPEIPATVTNEFRSLIVDCWQAAPADRPTFAQVLQRLQAIKQRGPPKMELSEQNANYYRKARTVFAYKSKDPVTIMKDWGKSQAPGGSYVILSGDDDVYLCTEDVFKQTYEPVQGTKHEYRKTGKILAKQLEEPFAIKTANGMEHGAAGDFLVQNEQKEQWVIARDTFTSLYELAR